MNKRIISGSRAVGLNNSDSDYEYAVLDNTISTLKVCYESDKVSLYKWNPDYLSRVLNYEVEPRFQLTTYLFDKDLNPKAKELNFDIMDHLEQMKIRIKRFCLLHGDQLDKVQSKLWYHVAYQYFILKNNSKVLTKEQLEIVKSIHDLKPQNEFLRNLIERIIIL